MKHSMKHAQHRIVMQGKGLSCIHVRHMQRCTSPQGSKAREAERASLLRSAQVELAASLTAHAAAEAQVQAVQGELRQVRWLYTTSDHGIATTAV